MQVRVLLPVPKIGDPRQRVADFTYSLFTIHSSLKIKADLGKVISNSEKVVVSASRMVLFFALILAVLNCFRQYSLRSRPKPFCHDYMLILTTFFAQIFLPRKSIPPFGFVGFIDFVPAMQAKFCHLYHPIVIIQIMHCKCNA